VIEKSARQLRLRIGVTGGQRIFKNNHAMFVQDQARETATLPFIGGQGLHPP
jgi:hypothetical protein